MPHTHTELSTLKEVSQSIYQGILLLGFEKGTQIFFLRLPLTFNLHKIIYFPHLTELLCINNRHVALTIAMV